MERSGIIKILIIFLQAEYHNLYNSKYFGEKDNKIFCFADGNHDEKYQWVLPTPKVRMHDLAGCS